MPTEELFNAGKKVDVIGYQGRIKSLLTTSNGATITLSRGVKEEEYLISKASANYRAKYSTALLAYSMGTLITIGVSAKSQTVTSIGIGALIVQKPAVLVKRKPAVKKVAKRTRKQS